jgi:hypothetical protein
MRPLLLLPLLFVLAGPSEAQRTAAPQDSTSARCMSTALLDARSICEGRVLNAVSVSLVGAAAGAGAGVVGGLLVPTRCIGNPEAAAVRGAILGGSLGFVSGLLTRHISRRELAGQEARRRAAALRDPVRPWSWRDLRPTVAVVGGLAVGGAAIGAVRGSRAPSPCDGGAGGGALTGSAVYGTGALAAIGGSLLVVRFLF